MKNMLAAGLVALSLTIFGCDKEAPKDDKSSANTELKRSDENGLAPDFTLTSVDNKSIRLSAYKGKVVIVDFWATWCPPCRKGIPDLIAIQKQYGSDVVVIGISVDTETKKDVIPFIRQNGINYLVAYATPEMVQAYGGIEAIPTSFVIDKNGKIVDKHEGLVPKSDYTDVINKLLN